MPGVTNANWLWPFSRSPAPTHHYHYQRLVDISKVTRGDSKYFEIKCHDSDVRYWVMQDGTGLWILVKSREQTPDPRGGYHPFASGVDPRLLIEKAVDLFLAGTQL